MFFTLWVLFWEVGRIHWYIFSFLAKKTLREIVIFLEFFPDHQLHLSPKLSTSINHLEIIYLLFYPIGRIFTWSTSIQIYFMLFVIQWINTINDKTTNFHWFFQPNLLSAIKYQKKLEKLRKLRKSCNHKWNINRIYNTKLPYSCI